MTPACMTPEELRLWHEAAAVAGRAAVKSPCVDCPLWFAQEMRQKACCNGTPGQLPPGRPRSKEPRELAGARLRPSKWRPWPSKYPTREARMEARRAQWRAAKQRQRAA